MVQIIFWQRTYVPINLLKFVNRKNIQGCHGDFNKVPKIISEKLRWIAAEGFGPQPSVCSSNWLLMLCTSMHELLASVHVNVLKTFYGFRLWGRRFTTWGMRSTSRSLREMLTSTSSAAISIKTSLNLEKKSKPLNKKVKWVELTSISCLKNWLENFSGNLL